MVGEGGHLPGVLHRMVHVVERNGARPDLGDDDGVVQLRRRALSPGPSRTATRATRSRSATWWRRWWTTGMPVRTWLPTLPAPSNCHTENGYWRRDRRRASAMRYIGRWASVHGGLVVVRSGPACRGGAPQKWGRPSTRFHSLATDHRSLRLRSSSCTCSARWAQTEHHAGAGESGGRGEARRMAEREVEPEQRAARPGGDVQQRIPRLSPGRVVHHIGGRHRWLERADPDGVSPPLRCAVGAPVHDDDPVEHVATVPERARAARGVTRCPGAENP